MDYPHLLSTPLAKVALLPLPANRYNYQRTCAPVIARRGPAHNEPCAQPEPLALGRAHTSRRGAKPCPRHDTRTPPRPANCQGIRRWATRRLRTSRPSGVTCRRQGVSASCGGATPSHAAPQDLYVCSEPLTRRPTSATERTQSSFLPPSTEAARISAKEPRTKATDMEQLACQTEERNARNK